MNVELKALPNIGNTLATELQKVGVTNRRDLKRLGSVEAAYRISLGRKGSCYNLLFALEGAIRGVPWHSIPKKERARLKNRFDRIREEPSGDPRRP